MAEIRRRWLDTGEQFAELGRKFQQRYEGGADEETERRLHDAIGNAIHAVDEVFISAGHALGDASLQDDARRALSALHQALLVTFTDATEQIEAAAERLRVGLGRLAELDEETASGTGV
jgi:sulfite reductase beta subunit-like hemoprotein